MTTPPFVPPNPGPPRRFAPGGVVAGLTLYLPLAFIGTVLAGLVNYLGEDGADLVTLQLIVMALGVLVPVGVGIAIATRGTTPWLRGFGLGLALGWAAWGVVGGGACVAIYAMIGGFSA